jgi:hypothetical protein
MLQRSRSAIGRFLSDAVGSFIDLKQNVEMAELHWPLQSEADLRRT